MWKMTFEIFIKSLFSISCSNSKWKYIFFRKFLERYFIVKKNKNFFGPYNVWKNWYPMTHWSICFYTHESFTLITYNISFIFTYLLHSGRHSTLYMNARVYQQLSAPCLWNRLVFNTFYPPVNKLFLSVTKFSLYISPYISFSKLVPMTFVLPSLRVLLCRLRMPYEFVRKKHLIFNCFDSCSIDVFI